MPDKTRFLTVGASASHLVFDRFTAVKLVCSAQFIGQPESGHQDALRTIFVTALPAAMRYADSIES